MKLLKTVFDKHIKCLEMKFFVAILYGVSFISVLALKQPHARTRTSILVCVKIFNMLYMYTLYMAYDNYRHCFIFGIFFLPWNALACSFSPCIRLIFEIDGNCQPTTEEQQQQKNTSTKLKRKNWEEEGKTHAY